MHSRTVQGGGNVNQRNCGYSSKKLLSLDTSRLRSSLRMDQVCTISNQCGHCMLHKLQLILDFQAGAPIDPTDKNKTTPLHLAAKYGHDSMAELLVTRGASLSKTDLSGKNALALAILHGNK